MQCFALPIHMELISLHFEFSQYSANDLQLLNAFPTISMLIQCGGSKVLASLHLQILSLCGLSSKSN